MKRVVIAGGIGAGKTALTDRLTALGFPVIDADVVARRVVEQGEPAYLALRDAFGTAVLTHGGDIDRKFLADVVFHDTSALRRLNLITHGYVEKDIEREVLGVSGPVVFIAIPLYRRELRERLQLDEVWAVQVDPETAIERLVSFRGFSADEARARLAVQMSNDERASIVDRVIWNDGTLEELYTKVDEALASLGVK